MSYIITAEVPLHDETNLHGDKGKVDARVLSERNGVITFDVPGVFGEEKQRTAELCKTLIEAGFITFCIGHSY